MLIRSHRLSQLTSGGRLRCSPPVASTHLRFDRRRVSHHPPLSTGASGASTSVPATSSAANADAEFETFVEYVLETQATILATAERMDGSGKKFRQDRWEREPGNPNAGFGITAVLEDGQLLEKAAANVSVIRGVLTPTRAAAMSSRGRAGIDPEGGQRYSAAALSLVFHSAHPLVPTLRGDVRLFQVAGQAWFGGGCDLTPYYLNDAETSRFHAYWKGVCERYGQELYPTCKATCDDYFYIPARKEHRGVGGIFYDDLSSSEAGFDVLGFTKDVGLGMLPSWEGYVNAVAGQPFTEEQREWQLIRRGRYLEFNLLYDRGVKFGLDGGRIESIMVSAPPLIRWKYDAQPAEGSEEARLVEVLRAPRDWA